MSKINDILNPPKDKNGNVIKKNKNSQRVLKKTVQDTLPYIEAYQNGMIMIEDGKFSITLAIEDISFKTKEDD